MERVGMTSHNTGCVSLMLAADTVVMGLGPAFCEVGP